MRITFLIPLTGMLMLFANNSYSQSTQVSLNLKNATVEEVLNEIEKKSDFYFLFNQKLVDVSRKVDIIVDNKPIKDILNELFKNQDVDYVVFDRQIILAPKEISKSMEELQQQKITGVVTDANTGEALPGVSIAIEGIASGTLTQSDGSFSIEVKGSKPVLVFSFVGYSTRKVQLSDQTMLDVKMVQEVLNLGEIVVVGYGTIAKRSLSTATSRIEPDERQMPAKVSVVQSMMGKASGLNISQNNAQPGGAQTLELRGKEPLIVVDGIPYSSSYDPDNSSEFKFNGVRRGPLNNLNPSDIESIEILKDAGAAIYGINASGGVILITTKKGKAGSVSVSYNASHSLLKNTKYIKPLNAKDYMQTMNQLSYDRYLYNNNMQPYGNIAPSGFTQPYSQAEIDVAGDGTKWLDYVLRDGTIDNHNLSISGGSEKTQAYFSINYFKQKGTVQNSGLDKFSGRLNLEQSLSKRFKFNTNLTFSRINYQNSTAGEQTTGGSEYYGVIQASIRYLPTLPLKQSNGDYTQFLNSPNPVTLRGLDDGTVSNRFFGQSSLEANLIDNVLSAKINFGANTDVAQRDFFIPRSVFWDQVNMSRGSITHNKRFQTTVEGYLTFKKNVGGLLNLNIMAGMGQYQENTWYSIMSFRNFNDAFETNNAASGNMYSMGSNKWKEKRRSYFGRAIFDILDRYVVTTSLRVDAVDKFFPTHKYGYFPGISIAWKMKNEPFLQQVKFLYDLKLRASYGITGRNTIGSTAYSTYGTSARGQIIDFNNGTTVEVPFYLSGLDYPNLKWEKTRMWNSGIDFAFLENRISGSFDAYLRDISDLLQLVDAPPLSFYSQYPVNGGIQRGYGLELNLKAKVISSKDLHWEVSGNISHNKEYWKDRFSGTTLAQYQKPHDPVRAWYYFETKGILQIGQKVPASQPSLASYPGCPIFVDQNSDGVIDYRDVKTRDVDPKIYYGLTSTLTYRNIDFTMTFYGQAGFYKVVPQLDWTNPRNLVNGSSNGITQMKDQVWYYGNPGGTIPGLLYDEFSLGLPVSSDVNYSKAGFLRCQNITLGYTFSSTKTKKIFKDLRVFFDVQNAFVITSYKGFDPEVDSYTTQAITARAPGAYPNARTYSIGLNVNF